MDKDDADRQQEDYHCVAFLAVVRQEVVESDDVGVPALDAYDLRSFADEQSVHSRMGA